jgi:hypothetical protein
MKTNRTYNKLKSKKWSTSKFVGKLLLIVLEIIWWSHLVNLFLLHTY